MDEEDLPLEDTGTAKRAPRQRGGRLNLRYLALIPAALALFMLGGVVGLYFQPPGLRAVFGITGLEPGGGTDTPIAIAIQKVEDREEIAVVSGGNVVALGRLIPEGDVAVVAPPYGSGDARIAEIEVKVGDTIERGQVLAVLDNLSQLESAVAIAEANLEVTNATLAQTRLTVKASLEEARASLARAEATARRTRADLERTTSLLERGVATRKAFDQAQSAAAEAIRDVERARATLSRYVVGDNIVQVDIMVAEANVKAAQAELSRTRAEAEKAFVRAPFAGQVLEIEARPGEKPGSEGVMTIGNTSKMSAEVEVYQTLIGRVAVGDPVSLIANALPEELTGTVTAIGLEIGRQTITSDDPAANTDARVVDVIVTLDERSSALAAPYTNLVVVARIDAGRRQ